jgi:hypothetical protein
MKADPENPANPPGQSSGAAENESSGDYVILTAGLTLAVNTFSLTYCL